MKMSDVASIERVAFRASAPPPSPPPSHLSFAVLMYSTLFPRMNASPYLFFSCPLTYSCGVRGAGA